MWHLFHYDPDCSYGRLRLKCDGTRAETRFRLSAKWTSPSKSAGASVQSTTGSRVVCINGSNGSNAGCAILRGSVNSTGYPLHSPVSPSLPHICVTVCHHISTGLYCTFTEYHGISWREVIQLCLLLIGYMQQSTQDTHNLCIALLCNVLRRELYYTKIYKIQ